MTIDPADEESIGEVRQLIAAAAPSIVAPPGLAGDVLARRTRQRRTRRVRGAVIGATTVGTVGIAAAVLPGQGRYFDHTMPSAAMEPTVKVSQTVVADKTLTPQRGDLVVIDVTADGQQFRFLSRAVALGGDVIECPDDGSGHCRSLVVSGRSIPEPWLSESTEPFAAVTVPEGTVFLLGDNRDAAQDSRALGPQLEERVAGVVVAVRASGGRLVRPPGAPEHQLPEGASVDPADPVPPAVVGN